MYYIESQARPRRRHEDLDEALAIARELVSDGAAEAAVYKAARADLRRFRDETLVAIVTPRGTKCAD